MSRSTTRRELTLAVLGSALAGGLALSASSQPWAHVTVLREAPLPPTSAVLDGSAAAPLVSACGLLLLAAAVAVIAVRGVARAVVGLLVAVAGGVLGWSGAVGLAGRLGVEPGDVPGAGTLGQTGVRTEAVHTWPALALVAGVLAVLAGGLVVLRGRGWPGMGRRYERGRTGPHQPTGRPAAQPAERVEPARPVTAEDEHSAAWKALDRGEDPTE
ncbi:Trp biosynthesis-associated membrane protein [Modestobacter sp. NPDC049651]|uniref:Trp biosynthesis-associated membrane protein n=1 Tax=unclassified Modestobacter TaxID=2643866 RepID=UPI0033F282A0